MIAILIIPVIVLGDLFIKNYIEENKSYGKEELILKDKIIISKFHNYGAAMNIGDGNPRMIARISAAMLGVLLIFFSLALLKKESKLFQFGTALLLGGSLSNTYDRFARGYVVDYFSFSCKWEKLKKVVFNLADMAILLGGILVFFDGIKRKILA